MFKRCQFRSKADTCHLIIRNLDEFHIPYLRALLTSDVDLIYHFEHQAKKSGYGPLLACSFSAPNAI